MNPAGAGSTHGQAPEAVPAAPGVVFSLGDANRKRGTLMLWKLLHPRGEAKPTPGYEDNAKGPEAEFTTVLARTAAGQGPAAVPEFVVALPRWLLWLHTALVLVALAVLIAIGLIAAVVWVPLILRPIALGPLAPWVQLLDWLWHHGEVSLPVLAALVLTFTVPALRARALRHIATAGYWMAMGSIAGLALFTAWRILAAVLHW